MTSNPINAASIKTNRPLINVELILPSLYLCKI
jgi:hypothetical protein